LRVSEQFELLYKPSDTLIKKLFEKYRKKSDPVDVFAKVAILDSYYSTNLKTEQVIKVIRCITSQGPEIDQALSHGTYEAFDKIRKCEIAEGGYGLWVFASKYCHFQSPDKYPIYDAYAAEALKWALKKPLDYEFGDDEYFSTWKPAIEQCRNLVGFPENDFKKIDQSLWMLGNKHRYQLRSGDRWKSVDEVYQDVFGTS
jgi:hypothetical protein